MHRFVISVMCAAALGLAGCMLGGSENVAQGVSHAGLDAPGGAAQDTRQADGADIPLDLPELSDFTTEGKPTKTIETPWGPREVYDPTQDEAVIEAFKNVYIMGEQAISEDYLSELLPNDILYESVRDLLAARKKFRQQLISENTVGFQNQNICELFTDATCRTYKNVCFSGGPCKLVSETPINWTVIPRNSANKYHPAYKFLPSTTQQELQLCDTNYGKQVISTDYKIIGDISPETFEEQLNWFFAYRCERHEKE